MNHKQTLLQELRDMGCDDDFVAWIARRNTAAGIQIYIDNCKALDIISEMARTGGLTKP